MNTEKAIKLLRRMQEPEAWEPQITGDAFDALEMAITALENNSNEQLNNSINNSNNSIKNCVKGLTACRAPKDDYISRQEAIDVCNYAIDLWHGQLGEGIVIAVRKKIAELPSVQPDIVHCKDCEYGEQDEVGRWFCRSFGCQIGNEDGSGYCADAERRTDE